jgi:hypothetical protein
MNALEVGAGPFWVKGRHRLTIRSSPLYLARTNVARCRRRGPPARHDYPRWDARPGSPSGPNHLTLSSSRRPSLDLEPPGNARDVVDRDIVFGPLDPAEIGAVDPALVHQPPRFCH